MRKVAKLVGQAWDNGYNDGYESGKDYGVKEFAEKLKGKLQDFGNGGEKGAYITEKDINETLNEYEVENENI